MNCIVCKKEIEGKINRKFCSSKCRNTLNNKKLIYLSTRLTPEQIEKLLTLQEEFLQLNRISKLKEKLNKIN